MTEKKDLWLVFLLGLITCGIYNIVVAISALKSIYKIKGDEEAFGNRIIIWIIYYSAYFVFTIGINVVQIVAVFLSADSASSDTAGSIIALTSGLGIMFISIAIPIIAMVLYYQEFEVLTQVSNNYGIKTTPGYKMACILLGAASIQIASLVLQARLNKLIDLENNRPSNPTNPTNPPMDGGNDKELVEL